jgi:protein-S-isoprenylcysteine O-methyltransferase Ste14
MLLAPWLSANQKEQGSSKPDIRKNIFRRFSQVTFTVFLTALVLFVSAGKLDWISGLDGLPKQLYGFIWLGLAVFLSGIALVSWSMVSNTYFSTAVRIQYDRDHSVSDGGPYRYMRHPGYLGMIIYNLATPVIFGSFWALLPAGILAYKFLNCISIINTDFNYEIILA